jgi:tetrahydromethanopterin S-methyltransferase subunit G
MADDQTEETNSLKERLAEVERELARITQINSEMYQYVVKNFVDEETTN